MDQDSLNQELDQSAPQHTVAMKVHPLYRAIPEVGLSDLVGFPGFVLL